jgi:membrane protein CcdC involved in cytochrome C biogenesis
MRKNPASDYPSDLEYERIKSNGLAALLMLCALPFLVVLMFSASGFVCSTLWAWFIVPIFGLPALNILQAIGVGLVVSFFTLRLKDLREEMKDQSPTEVWKRLAQKLGQLTAVHLVFLTSGYIVHRLMT